MNIRYAAGLVLGAGFLVLSTSVPAISAVSSNDGSVSIKAPLRANIFQQLDFGTIAPSLTTADTVKVLRGANNSSVCGANLTCFEDGNRARISVTGAPDQYFTTTEPGDVTLSNGQGATMLVDTWVGGGSGNDSAWGPRGKLRSDGTRNQSYGATLHVGANQPVGAYTGSYSVTIEYQ